MCLSFGQKDDADEIRGFILDKGMKGLSAPKIEGVSFHYVLPSDW